MSHRFTREESQRGAAAAKALPEARRREMRDRQSRAAVSRIRKDHTSGLTLNGCAVRVLADHPECRSLGELGELVKDLARQRGVSWRDVDEIRETLQRVLRAQ